MTKKSRKSRPKEISSGISDAMSRIVSDANRTKRRRAMIVGYARTSTWDHSSGQLRVSTHPLDAMVFRRRQCPSEYHTSDTDRLHSRLACATDPAIPADAWRSIYAVKHNNVAAQI